MARKRLTEKVTEDLDDPDAEVTDAPLFDAADPEAKGIDRIYCKRVDPDSGFMGYLPLDASEALIFSRWGGGEYRLEGKNRAGRLVRVRTVKIAGDPTFTSPTEERKWRRANGLPERGDSNGGMGIRDVLLMLEERDSKWRAEQLDREERERNKREELEARATKEREEREERRRRDEEEREERRARAAREDEERRARVHREEMERLQAQNAAQLQQSQQFFQQLATTLKTDAGGGGGNDAVKTLVTGMRLAQEMGGGGGGAGEAPEKGTLTTLVENLPNILEQVRHTGAAVASEIKNGRRGAAPAPAPRNGRKPAQLTITGPVAEKARRVIAKLAASGKNPEQEFDRLLTMADAAIPSPPPKVSGGGRATPGGNHAAHVQKRPGRGRSTNRATRRGAKPRGHQAATDHRRASSSGANGRPAAPVS